MGVTSDLAAKRLRHQLAIWRRGRFPVGHRPAKDGCAAVPVSQLAGYCFPGPDQHRAADSYRQPNGRAQPHTLQHGHANGHTHPNPSVDDRGHAPTKLPGQ